MTESKVSQAILNWSYSPNNATAVTFSRHSQKLVTQKSATISGGQWLLKWRKYSRTCVDIQRNTWLWFLVTWNWKTCQEWKGKGAGQAIELVKCRFNYLNHINWAWSMNEWLSCMPLNFRIETLLKCSLSVSISPRFDHCSTHTPDSLACLRLAAIIPLW